MSEIVKPNSGAMQVPDYIKQGDQGMENVRPEDRVLPRLRLSQQMSSWVGDGTAKAGDMVHSLDPKINFGDAVAIVPVMFFKSRIRWTPRNETAPPDAPKGMECVSDDGQKSRAVNGMTKDQKATDICSHCIYQEFKDGQPPRCTLYKNFGGLVISKEHGQHLLAISMEKTKIKTADALLTFASMLGGGKLPLYAGKYILKTKKMQNDRGEFYVYALEQNGFAASEEFAAAEAAYGSLKKRNLIVHMEEENEESGGGDDGDKAPF